MSTKRKLIELGTPVATWVNERTLEAKLVVMDYLAEQLPEDVAASILNGSMGFSYVPYAGTGYYAHLPFVPDDCIETASAMCEVRDAPLLKDKRYQLSGSAVHERKGRSDVSLRTYEARMNQSTTRMTWRLVEKRAVFGHMVFSTVHHGASNVDFAWCNQAYRCTYDYKARALLERWRRMFRVPDHRIGYRNNIGWDKVYIYHGFERQLNMKDHRIVEPRPGR